jgi:hypothetical protein
MLSGCDTGSSINRTQNNEINLQFGDPGLFPLMEGGYIVSMVRESESYFFLGLRFQTGD